MKIFGTHDQKTINQMTEVAKSAVKTAIMADGHAGYVMPVGGVAAYDNKVSIVGVGFDISCGNAAIKTDLKLKDIVKADIGIEDITSNPSLVRFNKELIKIADWIQKNIPFGIGTLSRSDIRIQDTPKDDSLFYDYAWNLITNNGGFREDLRDKARLQLGSVGSGNHYVDIFVDRNDSSIWVGVHFGSRGLGHTIASNFLAIAQGGNWGDRGQEVETLVDLSTYPGSDYWELMQLAGKYAYLGREFVTRKVVKMLGGKEIDLVHCNHNFAWKEKHYIDETEDLREVVVVRKGATPCAPLQRGFVGGSMGDDAVIIEGSDEYSVVGHLQEDAMFSTIHGSGRVMSRTEAAGKRDRKTGKLRKDAQGNIIKPPKVTRDMQNTWLEKEGVILRGGGVDESPHVYRRLPDVLNDQGDTIKIRHVLKPIIVVMAGEFDKDLYSD